MSAAPRSRPWDAAVDPPLDWLEAVNRHGLVTRMVAATVHDVSNALQVMSGAAEMLGLDASPDAVARRSASIVQQALGATGALQRLTAFSREPERPAETVDVRALCERVLQLRQYALRKGRITAEVRGEEARVQAPARALTQVLLNLVVNAETALADRADAALVLAVARDPDGVTVTVADNGPGLTPSAAAEVGLWPPPAATTGLGIGLLVSRALVERAGGSLAVGPAVGGGTVATIRLRG
ncbi:MAG: sensor histidine kinase [Vicinamibacterales bacterium]